MPRLESFAAVSSAMISSKGSKVQGFKGSKARKGATGFKLLFSVIGCPSSARTGDFD